MEGWYGEVRGDEGRGEDKGEVGGERRGSHCSIVCFEMAPGCLPPRGRDCVWLAISTHNKRLRGGPFSL